MIYNVYMIYMYVNIYIYIYICVCVYIYIYLNILYIYGNYENSTCDIMKPFQIIRKYQVVFERLVV